VIGADRSFINTLCAAAHVTAIDLQQEWRCAAPRFKANAVIEDAAVPAVGRVPDGISGLRL
jgi:hypothetical protein